MIIIQKNMKNKLSNRVLNLKTSSTLEIAANVIKLKKQGKKVISFTVGQPDFNTPSSICSAAKKAIDEGFTKYTAVAGYEELREKIANKFYKDNNIKYDIDQIICSNGGKQCLMNAFLAILDAEDEVIIPVPYWLSYPEMVKLAGGKPVFINTSIENNYKIDIKILKNYITDKTKALIINSPSNPTGMMYTEEELKNIAKFAIENDIYIISDEIYEYLVYTNIKHISIASLGDEIYNKTITINGLSKSYAMTGWRIGYLGASKEIVKAINKIQSHQTSNISSITQKAAYDALTNEQLEVKTMLDAFKNRRELMLNKLSENKQIQFLKPDGAFYIFIDFSNLIGKKYKDFIIRDSKDIAKILLEDYLVAVIPCEDFGCKNHIRLSYAVSDEDIILGVNNINRFCLEVK